MGKSLNVAFFDKIIVLPVKDIKYTKKIEKFLVKSQKFETILSSVKEIGLVEPPIVFEHEGEFLLLDGHLRLEALKRINCETVRCILSKDDENFTYNKHINRMACIQEHMMIKKAIEKGASPEKIAKALNMDVSSIIHKKNLLDGICPEAIEILKDKMVSSKVFGFLRKMKAVRQIKAANLMVAESNYTSKFARYILMGTTSDELVKPVLKRTVIAPEQCNKLEDEICHLQNEYSLIEEQYGNDVLSLTFVKGYVKFLFKNKRVIDYLQKNTPEIYSELEKLIEQEGLDT